MCFFVTTLVICSQRVLLQDKGHFQLKVNVCSAADDKIPLIPPKKRAGMVEGML